MIYNLNRRKIPFVLLNARITKKTFYKWNIVKSFAKELFPKINLCLPANKETKNYLKKLEQRLNLLEI